MYSFKCKDKDGTNVICFKDTWDNHIVAEHPFMKGCEAYVKSAIERPYTVYQDSGSINRLIIYKPYVLPIPFEKEYLRIVLEYKNHIIRGITAKVITAYATRNIKQGDILIWPKKQLS
jgi:hypothetical protein